MSVGEREREAGVSTFGNRMEGEEGKATQHDTSQLRVRLSFYMVHMVSLDSKRSGENEEESETC